MLNTLNEYLRIGLESTADASAAWPMMFIATALIAVAILRRQSDE